MISLNFTEDDFNKKILELFNISETLNDNWKIIEKNEKFYLSKKQQITVKRNIPQIEEISDPSLATQNLNDEVLSIEYHVLFHPSYQVPALYFNCYTEDSRLLPMEEISKVFVEDYEFESCHGKMLNIISQSEHPILFAPYYLIHPCKTSQVLSNFSESKNFVITFLTLFGPYVQLKIDERYEQFYYDP